jgi:pimeloyl-ACP methyl ester carboxylesterase
LLTYLALHYWAGAGHEYDHLRSLLPEGTQLLAPDLPGFGDEPAPAGFDYSVDSYADWVAAYGREQQLDEYVLVGHSMGGKIALALAARQPTGLRGLVLLSPSPPSPEPISDKDRASCLAAYGKLEEAEKTLANITDRPLRPEVCAQVIADNLRTSHAAGCTLFWCRAGCWWERPIAPSRPTPSATRRCRCCRAARPSQ